MEKYSPQEIKTCHPPKTINNISPSNYISFYDCKIISIIYSLLFLNLFSPYVFFGEVAAPPRQHFKIAATDITLRNLDTKSEFKRIENRKFNDYVNGTAYPQPVVFHAYIFGGYGLYLAYYKQQIGWHIAGRFLAFSATAVIGGAALALSVYIDFLKLSAESARMAPAPSFFTVVLPKFGTFTDLISTQAWDSHLFTVTTASPQGVTTL
jgi:hypothetical protein